MRLSRHDQGLSKLISDAAPEAVHEEKFENFFGRKIAVDASMHIYAMLVGPALSIMWRLGRSSHPPNCVKMKHTTKIHDAWYLLCVIDLPPCLNAIRRSWLEDKEISY